MCPSPDGNLAAGLQGAALASAAIFLPSFVFVAALGPIVPRLRKSVWAGRFLDAVNAASIGLMAAVTLALCVDVLLVHDSESGHVTAVSWTSVIIAGMAGSLLFRWKLSPAWLVAGGAAVGWAIGQML
jgi:chromate transporter